MILLMIPQIYEELNGLSQMLIAINQSLGQSSAALSRLADPDGNLWATITSSVKDLPSLLSLFTTS
jgi:hypothetical protein